MPIPWNDRCLGLTGAACVAGALLACAPGAVRQDAPPAGLPAPVSMPAATGPGADGYYALGRQYHADSRPAEARAAYARALDIDARHVDARNGLAVLHAERGDYAAAIALWQQIIADTGQTGAVQTGAVQSAFLHGNLGYAYLLQGDDEQAVAMLEKACVLDPLNARVWEHLAAALEKTGESARAVLMMRQARSLRSHDVRRDYALVRAPLPPQPSGAMHGAPSPWPAALARTEVLPGAAGLVHVRRVAAPAAVAAPSAAVSAVAPATLEIFNGNGVNGLAASLARSLRGPDLRVLRLANMKPYAVARTRVEFGAAGEQAARMVAQRLGVQQVKPQAQAMPADVRIVLGRDRRRLDAVPAQSAQAR